MCGQKITNQDGILQISIANLPISGNDLPERRTISQAKAMAEPTTTQPGPNMTGPDKAKLPDWAAPTKLAAALAALAYGTGVVALNTYLHGLGIADFSFAKPKLLLTGTLILASFMLLASAPIFTAWRMADGLAKTRDKDEAIALSRGILWVGIVSVLLLAFAAYLICFRLTTEIGQIRQWWLSSLINLESTSGKLLGCVAIVVLVYTPVWTTAFAAYKARQHLDRAHQQASLSHLYLERFYCALSLALLMGSVVAYIAIFTFIFYPSVPVEFGGGQPYFESFAINDGQQCQLRQIGIPFVDDVRGVTKPLPVLHESDTVVAVWVHRKVENTDDAQATEGKGWGKYDDVVVQLDKSTIIAIRSFPHARQVPILNRTQGPCTNNADPSAAPGK